MFKNTKINPKAKRLKLFQTNLKDQTVRNEKQLQNRKLKKIPNSYSMLKTWQT